MEFTIKDIITLVQTIGFPIFIAVWFLMRTEKILDKTTNALDRLVVIEEREIEVLRIIMLKYGVSEAEMNKARVEVVTKEKL